MASKLTFTGALGPGGSASSLVFDKINNLQFDMEHGVIKIDYDQPRKYQEVEISGLDSISGTLTGSVLTLTIH